MHAHRLVVDLAVKVAGGTFEEMVLAKKNPSTAAVAAFQHEEWHSALCKSMRHDTDHFKRFKCNEDLHVYSVNCKAIRSTPALSLTGGSTLFAEESNTPYVDAGATCTDSVDGEIRVRVSGAMEVQTNVAGTYKVTYTCKNSAGITTTKDRTVIVHHQKCPACVLEHGDIETIEASFPFDDLSSIKCSDFFEVTKSVVGTVDVEKVGQYKLTYVATDESGLKNTDCGADALVRTVNVVDSLKPVIGMKYKNRKTVFASTLSGEPDISPITGRKNPIYDEVAKKNLMAEASSTNGFVIGAIASAIAGVALLGYSSRKSATSVPV